jgi:hypothetical protein
MMLAAHGMGANGAIAWGRGGLRVMAAGEAANLSRRGIEGITSLDIHSDGADIELIPSDSFGFDIRTYSGEPEWSAEGGKLTIHERAGSGWLINVDFPLLKENYGSAYIKVYYPEGDALAGLAELAAESASGSIVVPDLGVRLRKASLATASGSIYADSLEAGELALETVSGNINVSGVAPQGGAGRADPGAGGTAPGTGMAKIALATSSGNISADSLEAGELTLETVSGSINVRSMASPRARLETASGNAKIAWFSGELSAETVSGRVDIGAADITCGISTMSGNVYIAAESITGNVSTVSGEVGISTAAGEDDLAYDIESVSGSVAVGEGGQRRHGIVRRTPLRGDALLLSIRTMSGNVSVKFGAAAPAPPS